MKNLREFITAFCSASLLFGGLYILKPSKSTEKAVKYIFSLIFICCVFSAILNIDISDFKFTTDNNSYIKSQASLSVNAAELTFKEVLKNAEINFSKITVCTNKNQNGDILINKVIVYSKESKDEIIALLGGNDAQYEIEVIYE